MNRYLRDKEGQLKAHLDSDEKLIWTGTPKHGIVFKSTDVFMIPFSLMWGGFAIFWEVMAINAGAPFFFMLWGIPFVLVGLYLIVGRFYFDSERRRKTTYGFTKDRLIIKSGVFKQSLVTINIKTMSNITLNEAGDGSGTIILGPEQGTAGMFRGTGWPGAGSAAVPALEMIPEARTVYKQLTDIMERAAP